MNYSTSWGSATSRTGETGTATWGSTTRTWGQEWGGTLTYFLTVSSALPTTTARWCTTHPQHSVWVQSLQVFTLCELQSTNILQKNYEPTITALEPVVGCSLGQRRGMSELDMRRVNSLYDCRGYQRVELSLEQRVRQGGVFPHTVLGRAGLYSSFLPLKGCQTFKGFGRKIVGTFFSFLSSVPYGEPMLEDVIMDQLAL